MRKKDNTDYYIHRHSCFLLQYHIVFVTKFRHPVLVNYDISGRTCQCPKDTNCQKSQKAVWRYEFKEVLLEALLLVRQLFYLIRE